MPTRKIPATLSAHAFALIGEEPFSLVTFSLALERESDPTAAAGGNPTRIGSADRDEHPKIKMGPSLRWDDGSRHERRKHVRSRALTPTLSRKREREQVRVTVSFDSKATY